MTAASEFRVVVSWPGGGQPIMIALYGPGGEASTPLSPVRALELAKQLIAPAVQAIKSSQWGEDWPG